MGDFADYDALSGSIKAEDVASNEMNARILRDIMNNDMNRSLLLLGFDDPPGVVSAMPENEFRASDAREMGWLGYFVGRSTRVTDLVLAPADDLSVMEPFYRGASRNKSIQELTFYRIEGGEIEGGSSTQVPTEPKIPATFLQQITPSSFQHALPSSRFRTTRTNLRHTHWPQTNKNNKQRTNFIPM